MHPLDSSRSKLRWAQHHLSILSESIRAHYDQGGEQDASQSAAPLVHKPFKIPPVIEWSLVVGDAVHNMRCTLDHLAYALAVKNSGGTKRPSRRTAFPIFEERNAKNFRNLTAEIEPEARNEIERLQPYGRKNSLWVLAELSNSDKHHKLSIVPLGVSFPTGFSVPAGKTVEIGLQDARIFEIDPATGQPQKEIYAGGKPTIFVELPRSGDRLPVDDLQEIHDFIAREVLPSFTRFFTAAAGVT